MLTAPAVIPSALAARVNDSCSATATNTRRLESGRRRKAVLELFGLERLGAGIDSPGRRDMLSRRPDEDNLRPKTFKKSPVRMRPTGVSRNRGRPTFGRPVVRI